VKRLAFFLVPLALLAGGSALAQSFIPFGARSVALGNAAIGLGGDEPESALDNPAATDQSRAKAAISLGGVGVEQGEFRAPLELITGNDPNALAAGASNLNDVVGALRTLALEGGGVVGTGRSGFMAGYQGYAVGYVDTSWSGSRARTDLTRIQSGNDPATSIRNNASTVAFRGLTLKDTSVSAAFTLVTGVTVGVAGHWLSGTTSSKEESVFTTEVGNPFQLARRGLAGTERTRTRFSWDAGVLITYGIVKVGGVMKAINEPAFPFDEESGPLPDRGRSVKLSRQTRIGASVKIPGIGIVVAADADLATSETLVDGLMSREIGGGLEWGIGPIVIRGGISTNLEAPDAAKILSAGFGVRLGPVHADGAAVYRTSSRAVGGVLTLRASM